MLGEDRRRRRSWGWSSADRDDRRVVLQKPQRFVGFALDDLLAAGGLAVEHGLIRLCPQPLRLNRG
ncbi:MAG: hypothetical protein AAFV53_00505 [Myxococcota bacterium]